MAPLLLETTATPQSTQWAMIILGVITVVYIVVIRPMRQKKKEQNDPLARTPTHTSLAQQRAVERDMNNLLVEYEQMIRKMTAHLDTRAAKLEILLREADEKLAKLSAAAASQSNGHSHARSDAAEEADPPSRPTADPEPDKRYAEIYKLADKGQSAKDIAKAMNCPRGEIDLILALRKR